MKFGGANFSNPPLNQLLNPILRRYRLVGQKICPPMFLQTAIGKGTSTGLDYLIGAMSFEEGSSSGVLSSIAIHG
ncbi:unnamed protein product, partial [Citrullus colocynthis]